MRTFIQQGIYMELQKKRRFILSIDSLGALAAGSITWTVAPLLQTLHRWTIEFAQFIALANIGYGLYSGILFLIFRKNIQVPLWPAAALVAGNSVWAMQCLMQAWRLKAEASYLGLGHLVLEAIYVGGLAYVEAKIFLFPKDVRHGGG